MDNVIKASLITGGATVISGLFLFLKKKKTLASRSKLVSLDEIQVQNALNELLRRVVQDFRISSDVHDNEVKEYVFKDIMYNKVSIWKKQIAKIQTHFTCRNNCKNCYTVDGSLSFHNEILRDGMQLYREYWKYNGKKYTKKEVEALEIALTKFTELHKHNEKRVLDTVEYGHKLDSSMSFCSQFTAYYIIRSYESALYSMLEDVELAIKDLNGDLSHLTFAKREYQL